MLHLKKALCAALAITMILIGTSCDVLLAPENPEKVTEKNPTEHIPSESTPGEADSTGRNPTETPPSESEKKEEPEDITSTEEITEEVTTEEELTEEVTTAHTHVEIVLEAVAPTCTETGLTEGKKCAECGEILAEQTKIAASGHTPDEWIIDKEPDWGIEGSKHSNCTVCGEYYEEVMDALYSKGLTYRSNGDGTCFVDGIGTCTDTKVVIPKIYNGEGVTGISDKAFNGCSALVSIIIPDSVTDIGAYAFDDCPALASITVSEGNPVYHSEGNCLIETASKTLALGCKDSRIPNDGSVTGIGAYAFSGCSGLASIPIPDSVTSIGDYAFYGCTGLTSITIPESVTSIGEMTFAYCSGLTSLVIPDSVTSIADPAFLDCSGLTSITVSEGNPVYHSEGNCLIETASKTLVVGCKNSRIPNDGSVTGIGNYAFSGSFRLTSIVIPDGVTSIGNGAFFDCTRLTSITLPNSMTDIGGSAFGGCTDLTDIYFAGTEAEWNSITKDSKWEPDSSYTLHFNYTPES